MPGFAPLRRARILEGMMLQASRGNADTLPPNEQSLAVRRHKVRHRPSEPHVPMQPQAAVHRMHHAVAAARELDPLEHQGRGISRRGNWRHTKRGPARLGTRQ